MSDEIADPAANDIPPVAGEALSESSESSDLPAASDTAAGVALLDLVAIEADLADVETALVRLEAGTYWTCEITGNPLPDDLMAAEPTRRRLSDA
jgi:RNA polymerase-binding transcription factor DksA